MTDSRTVDISNLKTLPKQVRAAISIIDGPTMILTASKENFRKLADQLDDVMDDRARLLAGFEALAGQVVPLNERLIAASDHLGRVPGLMRKTIIEVWVMGVVGLSGGVLIGWMLRGLV